MRIFLTGVSCVGKTTVGAKLAALLGCPFFDLDEEIERFFRVPIEHLQDQFLTMYSFRQEAAKALTSLLNREEGRDAVIALPPQTWPRSPLHQLGLKPVGFFGSNPLF